MFDTVDHWFRLLKCIKDCLHSACVAVNYELSIITSLLSTASGAVALGTARWSAHFLVGNLHIFSSPCGAIIHNHDTKHTEEVLNGTSLPQQDCGCRIGVNEDPKLDCLARRRSAVVEFQVIRRYDTSQY